MNRSRAGSLLLVVLVLAPFGCTQQAEIGGKTDPSSKGAAADDPWQTAVAELRKPGDHVSSRRVLNQLNADLSGKQSVAAPEPMSDAAVQQLAETLRLTDMEVKEVRGASFTGLDAAYLSDALYLRDAAKSLDVQGMPGIPVDVQAGAGFAWVCRQVHQRAWEFAAPDGSTVFAPPLPPTAVLKRGFGTGLERAYVFLALLQQLGLDGCLVGPPGQEQAVCMRVADGKLGKGPFWAVGVLSGADVLLFDPWRGLPLPGPCGKEIGTLAQLKKTPDQVKTWRDDPAKPWDVTEKDVADAVAYVSVPLSAVSLRAKLLEKQLAAGVGVELDADPRAAADRFAKAHIPAAIWAPPATKELFCYTRVQSTFLPKADGGLSPVEHKLQEQLQQAEVPRTLFVRPEGLDNTEALFVLAQVPFHQYQTALITPGFRQKIHRGQFHDVSRTLVETEKVFAAVEQRSRADATQGEAIKEWIEKARRVYRKLSDARKPENKANIPDAEAEVAMFWRAEHQGAQLVTDRALSAAGRAEIGFLLAVCKHEQAERAQLRFERAVAAGDRARAAADKARDAARTGWEASKDAWERYAPYADGQAVSFPGRAEHARQLSTRAARLAANPAADLSTP